MSCELANEHGLAGLPGLAGGCAPQAFPMIGDPASRMRPSGLPGDPPDPSALPRGCPFHPRCVDAIDICSTVDVELREIHGTDGSRRAACVHVEAVT